MKSTEQQLADEIAELKIAIKRREKRTGQRDILGEIELSLAILAFQLYTITARFEKHRALVREAYVGQRRDNE